MKRLTPYLVGLPLLAACSHQPPPDFAPDPGLVAHIRSIEMQAPSGACPGQSFPVSYTAVLDDSSRILFASRYDKKHPPRLHVTFLDRTSDAATPLEGGGWVADHDPLLSAQTGFRLRAALLVKPTIVASVTVAPNYDCMGHALSFIGSSGSGGRDGGDGPDVTVRLALGHSAFYERLLVIGVEVGVAPPFFLLADPDAVPPRDWLVVESRGGRGGRGVAGNAGGTGAAGSAGTCPGADGEPGSDGGNGGRGGDGGRGGRITIIAPTENPFLAGLVDARTPGGDPGPGGAGGKGGAGGAGGKGGTARDGNACLNGRRGVDGRTGTTGLDGRAGIDGPRPTVLTVPSRDVFGTRAPAELLDLLDRAARH